jgi:choline dehydrogenase
MLHYRYGGRFYPNPNPGCAHLEFQSDPYWECVIRHHTWSSYHDSGTCKMGPPTDPWAVVDPELRVYGVPNLRVADASIMPEITSGNINAPIIMIGEKAADLIKATAYYHAHGGYPTYGQSI